jgi:hypothetical protein
MKLHLLFLCTLLCSCSTYHREYIKRGKHLALENILKLNVGQTTKAEIKKIFGEPYIIGFVGKRDIWSYKYESGTIVAKELSMRAFMNKTVVEYSDLEGWEAYTIGNNNEQVAIGEFENWNDQSLIITFSGDTLHKYEFYYTFK